MRIARIAYKSQKLIRIELGYDETDNTIGSIRVTGDFFLYPEDSLQVLEDNLIGTVIERKWLVAKIGDSLGQSEVYGFDSDCLADAIMLARYSNDGRT